MNTNTFWHQDENFARTYQRLLVPAVFNYWSPLLLDTVELKPGERVLDVACGTGVVARLAAERVGPDGRVVGLDLSPEMLTVARSLPPVVGAPVEWREGDARQLPFEDASFDVVVCQQGLQFVPDRQQALSEMGRVLRPGGRVGLNVWRSMPDSPLIEATYKTLVKHLGAEAGRFTEIAYGLGDPASLETMLRAAGFERITIRAHDGPARYAAAGEYLSQRLSASPLRGLIEGLSQDRRAALMAELHEIVSAYETPNGFEFTMGSHLVRADKG